jgi:hypothetical protein
VWSARHLLVRPFDAFVAPIRGASTAVVALVFAIVVSSSGCGTDLAAPPAETFRRRGP